VSIYDVEGSLIECVESNANGNVENGVLGSTWNIMEESFDDLARC